MKLSITIFLLCICFVQSKAQLLDRELTKYENLICEHFKTSDDIYLSRNCKDILRLVYSRQLTLPVNDSHLKYYELGLTASHSYKYIAILNNNKFKIFKSKNFSEDYFDLVKPLQKKTLKVSVNKLISFLNNLKTTYDFNNKPSWKNE